MILGCRRLLLAVLLLYAATCGARAPDAWVITLLWSPEYCRINIGSDEPQCQQERYFELGGLEPRFVGADVPDCESGRLPPEVLERAMITLPNKALLRRTWRRQGACSGLGLDEYLVQLDRARRRVIVPDEYGAVQKKPLVTSKAALLEAFRQSNPGLEPDHIAPRCKGKWLYELRVCVDGDFRFQRCTVDVADQCPDQVKLRALKAGLTRNPPPDY